jgi:IS605 OrfB family transposase
MKNEMILTYQTRLTMNEEQSDILDQYAFILSAVERSLYAEVAKGLPAASCKNSFLNDFKITARQFNACRVSVDGKIDACKASQERSLANLKQQIATIEQKINHLEKKPSKLFVLHQKKRRRNTLQHRFESIESDLKHNRVKLCFGGKKLFNSQFYLEKNNFSSHAEWKKVWEAKRNSEFFLLGSKDESSGNQTCTAQLQNNGKLSLRLRLPKALEEKHGKYIKIHDVNFVYGQGAILAALNPTASQAISYRFKKDRKGWRVFASTALKKIETHSLEGNGAIGFDLNADHIAFVETDRFGNPISKKIFPWVSYGKSKAQLKAITGDLCKEIIQHALKSKKPVVIEKLDFQKKKIILKDESKKFARLLSSFSYGMFFGFLFARAFKQGIAVHQVNPAFTSVIGRCNYAERYGLSTHLAAALCIARRYQQFSESPCSPKGNIPDGKGGHVALVLPARNRTKHVCRFWGQVKKKIATVLAAHYQAIGNRSLSPLKPTFAIGIPDNYW